MTKHFAITQSKERHTFGCPMCGHLRLEDLGSHNVAFQFDLTGQSLTLARPQQPTSRATVRRHFVTR